MALEFTEDLEQKPLSKRTFVEVIIPLPLPKLYTYSVPFHLLNDLKIGVRAELQLGRLGLFSALIYDIHHQEPNYTTKPILSILDEEAIVTDKQLKMWKWMSEYYLCSMGEIMQAALPAALKLSGETKFVLYPHILENLSEYKDQLKNQELQLIDALEKHSELSLSELQKISGLKSIQSLIKTLMEKKFIFPKEELLQKYKAKKIGMVKLASAFSTDRPETLKAAFEIIGSRSNRQMETLMALLQLLKNNEFVSRKELCEKAAVDSTVLKKMEEKGVLELYELEISRLSANETDIVENYKLSTLQIKVLGEIEEKFNQNKAVLLHGVTGSGKTQVYIELIQQMIDQGKQVLYLLPEIALTAQMVGRLQKHFGDKILVYHSKFNNFERVEIWNEVMNGCPIILGARSSLFLPFNNLGLIIIDEEHDASFKQNDPSPRYNARDMSLILSQFHQAKILLGTATPSIETYNNVLNKKYELVNMFERFGGLELPKMMIIDIAEETKRKRMNGHFSPQLIEAIQQSIDAGEQVILFQNRRGYAPMYHCATCGWTADCEQCDVSLTYHKFSNDLQCHYCGTKQKLPKRCKVCESGQLNIKGFGTEKIEDDLKIYFPKAKIARMDWDTVKGKDGHDKIIQSFENKDIDILVGTQMVTKGLDFDNVGLVAVMNADQMLHFPDFRATERAFQMITQVAGRAGRKNKQGKVMIQTFNPSHPVLREVLKNDFETFLNRELTERRNFQYPPFFRLIHIQLKHKKQDVVAHAARHFAEALRNKVNDSILGPAAPGISRVRNLYLMDIIVKSTIRSAGNKELKSLIRNLSEELKSISSFSALRISIDVDPYN